MRQATAIIDGFGMAVVWLDEIEKSFSGVKSSGETDGGTTAAMFGHFLTWMAETKTPVLVMAAANDISKLPPEFMRAGRFDAIYFVDLPGKSERIEIIRIMNRKYRTEIPVNYEAKLNGFIPKSGSSISKSPLNALNMCLSILAVTRTGWPFQITESFR